MPENTRIGTVKGWAGSQLCRPECVLAHRSGLLFVPNWSSDGGYSLIDNAGKTHHILAAQAGFALRPNGIALENGGSVLLAHMGEINGGIYRMQPDGSVEAVVKTADHLPLPPTNYVVLDTAGRIWITVSTRISPRASDYRRRACSGFIAVADPGSTNATIVADGLGYANECVIDEQNACVYVNETFGRRLTRYTLHEGQNPRLSDPQICCTFGKGTYPDGLALDAEGWLWVTSIVSNRILRVSPDGLCELMFEDSCHEHIDWTETAYSADRLGRPHLDTAPSSQVKNISNLAFAGKALSRLYLGNLLGNSLPYIETRFKGAPMTHWNVNLGSLEIYAQ